MCIYNMYLYRNIDSVILGTQLVESMFMVDCLSKT